MRSAPWCFILCLASLGLVPSGFGLEGEAKAEPAWTTQAPGTFVRRCPYYLTSEPGFAWDSVHGVFLGWGGHHLGQEQSHDVWALDPARGTWRCMHPGLSPRACCCSPQLSFDAHAGRLLSFGGDGGQSHGWMSVTIQGFEQSIPFAYDYAVNRWTAMRPHPEPPGGVRQYKGFTYHPQYRVHVLFSGGKEQARDTWVYDLYSNEWTRLEPKGTPAGRKGHVLCYDPVSNEILMQGGKDDDPAVYTLSLEENRWAPLEARTNPSTLFAPVFAYDPHAQAPVLAGLYREAKNDGRLEIWRYDRDERTWKQEPLPESGEVPGRQRAFGNLGWAAAYSPELNLYLFCGGSMGPGNFHTWTWRMAPTRTLPVSPKLNARLLARSDGVRIRWDGVPGAEGYEILRADGPRHWQSAFEKIASTRETSFEDREVAPGKIRYYRVRALSADPALPAAEDLVRTQFPAPAAPRVSVAARDAVDVALPPASPGSKGFLIERAPAWTRRSANRFERMQVHMERGRFTQITQTPVTGEVFRDPVDLTAIPDDRRFEAPENPICVLYPNDQAPDPVWNPLAVFVYRIREINALDVASGPSPWVTTLPAPPDPVRTEAPGVDDPQAGRVRVHWTATGQQSVAGYRVYRQLTKHAGPTWGKEWEVPHHNDPDRWHKLSRGTVAGLEFLDETIPGGLSRRRYYVTAVDAFGQEGPPSTGAWAYRAESYPVYGPVKGTPRMMVPELQAEVTLDGEPREEAWAKAAQVSLRFLDGREQAPTQATEVRLFTHDGSLYGFARCAEARPEEILKHDQWPRDCNFLWKDDTVEFSLVAGEDADEESPIHHLMFSASPCHRDEYGPLGKRDKKAWDPQVGKSFAIGKDAWTLEFRLPLSNLKAPQPPPRVWRMNIFRNRQQSAHRSLEESAWAPSFCDEPHVPARFGYVVFEAFGATFEDLKPNE